MNSVAVFCGSSEGYDENIINEAISLGHLLAEREIDLVYGAARIGLMGHIARTVLEKGGTVIGIIPEFLQKKEIVNSEITELIVTKSMHDRKIIMYERSEGFLIIPGGFGTMDEFFEITTWSQLGLHSKPIGILNIRGFYDHLLKQFEHMVKTGFLKSENHSAIIVDTDSKRLLQRMKEYTPEPIPKWLQKEGL
ncbi:MAG: TIGR00730 family Rossman fold protein [Bacteroidia bacterium]|nr:TIGR00730 family Rossman fold protein [Bacteroidia bacterium]